jgi:hypothetical protein
MTMELLLDIAPDFVRHHRGPRLAPTAEAVLAGKETISITLGPDLVPDDAALLVASLGALTGVEVLVAPEAEGVFGPGVGGTAWSLAGPDKDREMSASWPATAPRKGQIYHGWLERADSGGVPLGLLQLLDTDHKAAVAMFRALQVHGRGMPRAVLFVTRSPQVLSARWRDAYPREVGQCTPEEALVLLGLLLRQQPSVPQRVLPGASLMSSRYDWYSGAAQLLLPRYRDMFSRIATEAERRGNPDDSSLAHLEGVATRCKHLLKAHDALGLLHLREADSEANNDTTEDQTRHFYHAVDAAIGMLESLAMAVALLEGHLAPADSEWRNVTFPNLRARQRPWVKGLNRYAATVGAAQAAWTPLLTLATSERKQAFHHYPVIGVTTKFGHVLQVMRPDGTGASRFVADLSVGCIKPAELPSDLSWVSSGTDGILEVGGQLHLFPWLFIRAMIRDLVVVVDRVLEALMLADGVALTPQPTEWLMPEGQALAQRMLAFDVPFFS